VQVLQPLRPCMRIVLTPLELKGILKSALKFMEVARQRQGQVQRETQELKLQEFLLRTRKSDPAV
jgi:hypothetical protein